MIDLRTDGELPTEFGSFLAEVYAVACRHWGQGPDDERQAVGQAIAGLATLTKDELLDLTHRMLRLWVVAAYCASLWALLRGPEGRRDADALGAMLRRESAT